VDGWQIIADEHGLFTAKDARAAGLRWRELERLVSDDEAVRLCRGWYALPLEPLPADEDSPAERRRRCTGSSRAPPCAASRAEQ